MTQPSATLAAILRAIPGAIGARPGPPWRRHADRSGQPHRAAGARHRTAAGRRRSAQAPDGAVRRVHRRAGALIDEALRPDAGDPCSRARCRNTATPSSVNTWNCAARKPPTSASCTAINTVAHPAAAPGARRGRESLAAARRGFFGIMATGGADRASVAESTAGPHRRGPRVHARALLDAPALARLQRLDALASDPRVRQYEAIREKQGPRSGSEEANAQGLLARQRGVAVEILAARALAGAASGPGVPIRITPW